MAAAARWLRLALLAHVVVWFGLVVPGHQRGQVTLPGGRVVSAGCCAALPVPIARHGAPAVPHRFPPTRACAICFFAAHLTVPAAIDVAQAPLGFFRLLRPPAPARSPARAVPLPFDGRAPPAAAAVA